MKKLKVLFLSLLALTTIVSCSKDDDNDSSTSASIEGKWEFTQEGESLTSLEPAENEGNCGLDITEYISGGEFKETYYYMNNEECKSYNDSGTWSKNGNTLTKKYTNDDEPDTYEIIELSQTTLKLKEIDEEGTWYTVYKRK